MGQGKMKELLHPPTVSSYSHNSHLQPTNLMMIKVTTDQHYSIYSIRTVSARSDLKMTNRYTQSQAEVSGVWMGGIFHKL